jgi:hypothetical protein
VPVVAAMTPFQFMSFDLNVRNAWCSVGSTEIYLRKSIRVLDGERRDKVLDLANVTVPERFRRIGLFSGILLDTMDQAKSVGYEYMYIENVMHEWFAEHFRKGGWTQEPTPVGASLGLYLPCFYKKL